MAKQYIIRVSRVLKKTTPSCSVVTCAMTMVYQFQNVLDFFVWLDSFQYDHERGRLKIDSIRCGSFFSPWSLKDNIPLGMTHKEYCEWRISQIK